MHGLFRRTSLSVAALMLGACSVQVTDGPVMTDMDAANVEFMDPSNGRAPYSRSVRVGPTVYLSGVLGSRDGVLVDGGIEAQTHQAIDNISTALARHGLTLSSVVRCGVFLANIDDFDAMNGVYTTRFGPPRPARTTVAADIVAGALIEIDCIAAFDDTP
ncbi:MAG: RidA family protein [Pseudomonadota bacterium]